MGTEWLEPVSPDIADQWPAETLGAMLERFGEELPDLRGARIALIGVPEQRAAAHDVADSVRKALYSLYWGPWDLRVVDLGNIRPGRDRVDTLVAVEELAVEILKYGCIPVFMGAGSDWPLGVYRAYGKMEQMINACLINSRISLGDDQNLPDRSNLLAHLLTHKPYHLFHVSHLAHQSYFVPQSALDLAEKMHLEVHRVGEMHPINRAEPWIRDADLAIFHNGAVRAADAPAQHEANPNGLTGESLCALLRFAGFSDKLSSICLADFVGSRDLDGQNAHLWAQGLWYFIDGVSGRVGDFPLRLKSENLKFTVLLPDEQGEMVFYKSPLSLRWWIEVPNNPTEGARHQLVPCSQEDYELAQSGTVPNVWWRIVRRGL